MLHEKSRLGPGISENLKLIEKYWGGYGQKWVQSPFSSNCKIGSKTGWKKLSFCMHLQIQES